VYVRLQSVCLIDYLTRRASLSSLSLVVNAGAWSSLHRNESHQSYDAACAAAFCWIAFIGLPCPKKMAGIDFIFNLA
jgi:hypothetical protein